MWVVRKNGWLCGRFGINWKNRQTWDQRFRSDFWYLKSCIHIMIFEEVWNSVRKQTKKTTTEECITSQMKKKYESKIALWLLSNKQKSTISVSFWEFFFYFCDLWQYYVRCKIYNWLSAHQKTQKKPFAYAFNLNGIILLKHDKVLTVTIYSYLFFLLCGSQNYTTESTVLQFRKTLLICVGNLFAVE